MQRDDRRAEPEALEGEVNGKQCKVVVPAEGKKITLQNGKLNVPENRLSRSLKATVSALM